MALAHPDTMQPSRPGPTRTAPPASPDGYPFRRPRYRAYVLYAATSVLFLLEGLILLRGVRALGAGSQAWEGFVQDLSHPAYIAWHALMLVVTLWFGARTYFKLFVKTQPPTLPLPPLELIPPAIGVAWLAVTVALVAILGGALL
jgi:fumarate reductase subunit C